MMRVPWPVLLGVTGLTLALASTSAAQRATTFSGTYRVAVCKRGPCAPRRESAALVWGTVVLTDDSLPLATWPPAARRTLSTTFSTRPLNGCWVLTRTSARVPSYAGIGGVGGMHWAPVASKAGGLMMDLYYSPDAGHGVVATLTPTGFVGTGESAGAGVVEVQWPTDTIVAERLGPPDLAVCVQAALVKARASR